MKFGVNSIRQRLVYLMFGLNRHPPPLTTFTDILKHVSGELGGYMFQISTSRLESANNKTKTMKRQTHGYGD